MNVKLRHRTLIIAVTVLLSLVAAPIWAAGGDQPGDADAAKTAGTTTPTTCGSSHQIYSYASQTFDMYFSLYIVSNTTHLSAGVTSSQSGWRVSMHYGSRGLNYGTASTVYVNNPASGYWYIRVYASPGTRVGTFWTTCSNSSSVSGWTGGACSNIGDAGGSTSSALRVTYGRCYNASIGSGGDNDYYLFYFNGGTLNAFSLGSIDTYAYLYNSSGSLLTSNDDSGVNRNFHINRSATAGWYYLRVRHYYSSTGTGPYILYLGGTGSGASTTTTNSSTNCLAARSTAHYVGYNSSSVWGNIANPGSWYFYRVTIPGYVGGTLTVYSNYAVQSNLDVYGYLFDSNCVELTRNDDGGTGFNFRFSRYVTPGTYYIGVRAFNSSATGQFFIYTNWQQRQ